MLWGEHNRQYKNGERRKDKAIPLGNSRGAESKSGRLCKRITVKRENLIMFHKIHMYYVGLD